MREGAGVPPREFESLGLRPPLLMTLRGLRPRKRQIAYRRFATFPRRDTRSLPKAPCVKQAFRERPHAQLRHAGGELWEQRVRSSCGRMWPKAATCNLIPARHRRAASLGAKREARATKFAHRM